MSASDRYKSPGAPKNPEPGPVGSREKVGDARSSHKHPPHVSESAEEAELQEQNSSPDDVPVIPPLAQGQDKRPVDEIEQGIDDESMYDRRPSENKNTPPSSTGGA
jgi:hypothetical protein